MANLWLINLWLMIGITIYLHGGDWNHGMDYDFPETVGNGMSSSQLTNSLHHFSEGWLETTNQLKGSYMFFLQKVHTVSDRLSTGIKLYVNISNNPARFL